MTAWQEKWDERIVRPDRQGRDRHRLARGIGKASVEALADHGAKVVISSRKQDACDAVAAELNARHGAGTALAMAASISDKDALQHLVEETAACLRADRRAGLQRCLRTPITGRWPGIADDQFRKILDNNILSNHWLIQMVAPEMRSADARDRS